MLNSFNSAFLHISTLGIAFMQGNMIKKRIIIISADSCLLMHARRSVIYMSSNHVEMTQFLVFQPQGKMPVSSLRNGAISVWSSLNTWNVSEESKLLFNLIHVYSELNPTELRGTQTHAYKDSAAGSKCYEPKCA